MHSSLYRNLEGGCTFLQASSVLSTIGPLDGILPPFQLLYPSGSLAKSVHEADELTR